MDLVLAEFASLNNLADRRDLPRVFDAVAGALGDHGWFSFDVNAPLSLRTEYPQTFWLEDKRFRLVQHGSLEADGRRARLDFEWLLRSGRLLRHVRETLWHVCWTDAEIRRALQVAGFDLVRSFDGLDVRPRTPGESEHADSDGGKVGKPEENGFSLSMRRPNDKSGSGRQLTYCWTTSQ